ncbi:MAG: ATP-binding protein [Deltaproteobacteria bacterium]|nr:ATP-binding protein [Deltaproteobacteria bacterium]
MIPIDEKLKILEPILGRKKIQRLRQMYFFEDDFRAKKEIENLIDLFISRHAKNDIDDKIILPPPAQDLCQGDLNIGEIEYIDKPISNFNLKPKDINRHMGIFGSTGSGKTTFAKHLIRQLYKKGIPFLIFDWEKSYRNLINEFDDVQVMTVGSDINPLFLNFLNVPPGIPYDEYIKSIIAIISEDYIGGIGADTMLLNYMEMAYQETQNPFFEDLKQIVLREITRDMGKRGRLAGRSGLWKESVSRQITFLSKGASGAVVNPKRHYPLEELFSGPIVLEFGNLKSPYDRKFFIHVILNWLSIYNQHCGIHSEHLKQVMIFEEFHNIAMKGKEDNMVSTLFRESRKYGIGLIAIDQTPSEIPNAIFANMNTKVSFSLSTSRDITSMAKAMNLDTYKSKYLGMLKTGQAIINIKQRHHDPFLLRAPFAKQNENIQDEELRGRMKKFADNTTPDIQELDNPGISQSSHNTDKLPPLEKCVFTNIIERPLDGVDQRTKRLGLHPSTMAELHASLSEKGLVKGLTIDKKKLFEITDMGRMAAEKTGIKITKKPTKGGIEHTYWVYETARFLKKHAFQPALEVNGIDIVDTESKIAIEIETGKSDIHQNLLKLKNSHVSRRFMLATTKPAEIKLRKFSKDFPSIQVLFVKDFFKLTKDQLTSPSPSKDTTPEQIHKSHT